MALKFSANISTMFTDIPFVERFGKAKELDFKCVEIQNPYVIASETLGTKLKGLDCDLVNIPGGDTGFGFAADPMKQDEFLKSLDYVTDYYNVLKFKKLHIMSGVINPKYDQNDHFQTLCASLNMLLEGDFLENINVIGLIEPISPEVNANYFLNSFETAVEVIRQVGSPQIKLLLDVYHLHKITGDVRQFLEIYYPYAGHIQISQAPGRREPFCAGGEIDYSFVFDFLRQHKHTDYIGLEYFPSDSTKEGFDWMKKFTG